MAFNVNYTFWVATSYDLKDLLLRQHAVKKLKAIDRLQVHDILAEIYARYVVIVNKLGYLFDQTYQVQKRAFIKKLLEAATKRLLELRNELKKLELSEFIYIDKTLVQKKLIPQDVQLIRPFYFPYMRTEEVDKIINGPRIVEYNSEEDSEKSQSSVKSNKSVQSTDSLHEKEKIKPKKNKKPIGVPKPVTVQLTPEQLAVKNAVTLIQAHEKARQARAWFANIKRDPKRYAPKMPDLTGKVNYEFMHKPGQAMLILVKRTKFEANYFLDTKGRPKFDYYIKPSREIKKKTVEEQVGKHTGELQHTEKPDELDQLSLCRDFLNPAKRPGSFHLLSEYDSIHAETYFKEGLLKKTCGVELKTTLSMSSVPDPVSSQSANQRAKEYAAAALIQKTWKSYKLRRLAKQTSLQRNILYGMYDERKGRKNTHKEQSEFRRQRRLRKFWFDQAFIQACEDEKARILKIRTPWIMEDISDHIRAWFREFYDGAGEFHEYPDELKGGTILLVKGETLTLPEFLKKKSEKKKSKEEKKKEAEKKKAELAKQKAKALKEKRRAERKAAQLKKAGGMTFEFSSLVENPNVKQIEKAMREYEVEWEHVDERNNIKEDPYMHWITLDKYDEVYKELRITVDELMRVEYELLQKALAKDRKKKYKPKKKKQKKKKKNKKKKGKKVKDLTADRSVASLYYEMEDEGLIKRYPKRDFDEYIGDYNYRAYEIRNFLDMDTPPSKGEVKDVLREYIIGMGPLDLPKPRSVCIAGPIGSGKSLILDILATEVDAVLIDLSPENVIKFADRMPYLIHIVTKMAKILQPTIIAIRGVHRLFWKKIPKDQMDIQPRLLGKYLFKKIVKPIKKEDKILVVGLTEAPFQAKGKMKKCFDRILLLPNTDYGTAFLLWRSVTLSMPGVPRDFDFSPLAMVTKAYTTGHIFDNIQETVNIKRRLKLSRQPLKHMEFLEYFLDRPQPHFPPSEAEYEKFFKWFRKVDKLTKQRAKYLKQVQEAKEKEKKNKEKGKKAGK